MNKEKHNNNVAKPQRKINVSRPKGTSPPQWNGGIEAEAVQPHPKQILFLLKY